MANPFFNSGINALPEKTEQQNENMQTENSSYESTPEISQAEISPQKSGPNPVMVGKTNEKLTVFQGDLREQIASFFRSWAKSEGSEKSKILWFFEDMTGKKQDLQSNIRQLDFGFRICLSVTAHSSEVK